MRTCPIRIASFAVACIAVAAWMQAVVAQDWPPLKVAGKANELNGRTLETFEHGVKAEWGYEGPQRDSLIVIHPKTPRKGAPLYVVLHSAGHDFESCVNCTKTVGNHDIYRSPDDHFALYVDCRRNTGRDWWWGGMHAKDKTLTDRNAGPDSRPVEKRVIDTVKWAIAQYECDPNRVYLSGNSMGGSGTLGIGLRHGDVFAAIKANVPAGVEHVAHRMSFPPHTGTNVATLPEPPIAIDYSAQNDGWAFGHDQFVAAMNDRRYPLYFYWGPFGHANNSSQIMKVNDLIDSFDWLSVKKNEPYAAFTNGSTNSRLPWPDDLKSNEAGQVNAFFRYKNLTDTADKFEIALFLADAESLKTRFTVPAEATADVTLRRRQSFHLAPSAKFRWTYGGSKGEGTVDDQGRVTVPGLKISASPTNLSLAKP